MSERFLKLGDLKHMFSVSRSTVWRWHSEQGLRVVCIGGVKRVRESDLEAFLKHHEAEGGNAELPRIQPNET